MKKKHGVFNTVSAAVCLALCMVLPLLTGQIPQIGRLLSPMHIPVLLAGFISGPVWALAVGFIAPLLRGAIFGMPPLMPTGLAMAFELASYGLVAGLMYNALPQKKSSIYITLITAMTAGRIIWGCAMVAILGTGGDGFTFTAFVSGALTGAVPGIILHIALIPLIVMALEKTGLTHKTLR